MSWDEAIHGIATGLKIIQATQHPKTIIHTHYTGTCSVIAGDFPTRFFKRLGATEVDPDTVCNKAGHEGLGYALGASFIGFDPRASAGVLYLNGAVTRGVDLDYVTAPQLARAGHKTISHMDLAETLADPGRSRAPFCWNNNIVASSPRQADLRKALARDGLLHVVIDLFATDTADYADYVLPAASFLEFDDVVLPYFFNVVSARRKIVEPMGEALPNQEIFRRLARAMNFVEPELYEDDPSIIAEMLSRTGSSVDFAELARRGTVIPETPSVAFADLHFPTPSGKIEIASERAAKAGHPRAPVAHADQPTAPDRLRILSPASPWTLNSSYGNDGKIRTQLGPPVVLVHPDDALRLALADGAAALLSNEAGSLPVIVSISGEVQPGVAVVYKGRWPKCDPAHANVNILNPGDKTDMGESSCVHAVEAQLAPWQENRWRGNTVPTFFTILTS